MTSKTPENQTAAESSQVKPLQGAYSPDEVHQRTGLRSSITNA